MSAGIFQKYLPSNSAISPSGMKSRYFCQLAIVITVPGAIVSDAPSALVPEWSVSAAHDAAPPSNAQITIANRIRFITPIVLQPNTLQPGVYSHMVDIERRLDLVVEQNDLLPGDAQPVRLPPQQMLIEPEVARRPPLGRPIDIDLPV